ncbi:hypothetical protein [Parasphingopyxis sp.]|uniref:hypothetical protein n=2 Tax=Parasphingopyxis TaxID=1234545 RepID=UPI0032EBB3C3
MIRMPPKPRVLWDDIKSFFSRGERHHWIAIIPAMMVPAGIFYLFVLDAETNIVSDEPVVIYAESWPLGRTDEEIIERQREFALERNEQIALRRQRFQEAAEALGVEYDREAAAEADRITEENRRTLRRAEGEAAGAENAEPEAETDAAGR